MKFSKTYTLQSHSFIMFTVLRYTILCYDNNVIYSSIYVKQHRNITPHSCGRIENTRLMIYKQPAGISRSFSMKKDGLFSPY